MTDRTAALPVQPRGFATAWRGHFWLFDKAHPPSTYGGTAGAVLLLTVVGLEAARMLLRSMESPAAPFWLAIPVLLTLALLAVRLLTHLQFTAVGLRPWSSWNGTERSFFFQVLLISNVLFPVVFAAQLRKVLGEATSLIPTVTVFVPYLVFGFYQEVLYRGMLQTELVRRWGLVAGILVSNALYTFGPLHYYYFSSGASLAVPMFAAIFGMGLVFAGIFRRSENLWIVGVMHALGNAYIVTSLGPVR